MFYARCYVELHKPELCVYICKELTQIGFQNSTYILLLQAKAYETGAGLFVDLVYIYDQWLIHFRITISTNML